MIRFGDFALSPESRELLRKGQPVHLTSKAFALLHVLIDHRPKAIPKAVIHDRLWPATFVSESNLTSLVSELRAALGDEARRPRFLRTVHGFGYAFCGVAQEALTASGVPSSNLWYFIDRVGRRVRLNEGENVVGRQPDAAVWLDLPSVSRVHALIRVGASGATLEDLQSRNGTRLNGQVAGSRMPLHDGDRIGVASEELVFRAISGTDLGPTWPEP